VEGRGVEERERELELEQQQQEEEEEEEEEECHLFNVLALRPAHHSRFRACPAFHVNHLGVKV
jgi:hypothetical protein